MSRTVNEIKDEILDFLETFQFLQSQIKLYKLKG